MSAAAMEQQEAKSMEDDRPQQNPVVILKDSSRKSRTEQSRIDQDAPLDVEGSDELGTSQHAQGLGEDSEEDHGGMSGDVGLLDLSKKESQASPEFMSCSSSQSNSQFVVLAERDDDDDEHHGQDSVDNSEDSAATSMQGSAANNFYKCTMCDKVFYYKQRLLEHMNKHMGVKPFACPLCPANFNSMASLQRHRRSHKSSSVDVQTHTCGQCHAQFSNSQHLTEHMKIHAEKRSCLQCGIFVGGMRSLQKHMAAEHPYIVRPVKRNRAAGTLPRGLLHAGSKKHSAITGSKPVICRQCGRQFQTTSALHGHMKGHSKLYQWKPRRCRCGLLLADEAEYKRHLKTSNCYHALSQPPIGSPSTLSPVSPLNIPQGIELISSGQTSMRSRSLDSGLKSPPYTTTHIPVSSSMSFEEAASRDRGPPRIPVREVEFRSLSHERDMDNDSSFSKDTVSSVSMSERSSGSPTERVVIKTEEWTVVDAGPMVTDDPSLERSGRGVVDQSQARSDHPPQVRLQQMGEPVERHGEGIAANPERRACSTEATSSSLGFARSEPPGMVVGLHPRGSSDSPSMQISSSQSGQPVASPLLSPTAMAQRPPNGSPWRCSYCAISFEDSLMYVIHRGCHEPTSPFKCSMCGEQCGDKVAFMLHFVRGEHKKPTHV